MSETSEQDQDQSVAATAEAAVGVNVAQSDGDEQDSSCVAEETVSTDKAVVDSDEGESGSDTETLKSTAHKTHSVLELQLADAEKRVASLKEEALRAQAEVQNLRRRTKKDIENAHKFALEKFVNELLPVADSLERGLEAIPDTDTAQQASRSGIELTLKMFLEVLKKFDVVVVDPVGEPFDPQFHQAMSMQPSDQVEPNSVISVLQKGYTLSGRLIRPAMVMVAKAPDS